MGVLIELRSETDFVAKSEPFVKLAHDLALQLVDMREERVEEFLSQPFIRNESRVVKDLITDVIAQVGENIQLKGFARREI